MTQLPFPTGVPVTGEDLIGREKDVADICDLVKLGQSVILIAPRRFGKSSVLLEVLRRLKGAGVLVGLVDLFDVLSKKELAEKIVDSTLENVRIKHFIRQLKEDVVNALKQIEIKQTISEFEYTIAFSNMQRDENELLESSLDFPEEFAVKKGRRLVFAYDEFSDLVKLNGESLLKKMRAKFQRHKNVSYIFSGSQESLMNELFLGKSSAFFRFGRIFRLKEIPLGAFARYIGDTFSKLKIRVQDELIDKILGLTGCHPFYTQLLCQTIYLAVKGEKAKVDEADIKECHYRVILGEKAYFEDLWNRLRERKYALLVLKSVALEEASPYKLGLNKQTVYRALTNLERRGYIYRGENGNYRMVDPFFRDYLRFRRQEQ
ncbi:MAG: ATP-binding protein [bacterium]